MDADHHPHQQPQEQSAEPSELERETGERRRGRHIVVAVNHSPTSKHAFDWTITHLCRLADTLHIVHVITSCVPASTLVPFAAACLPAGFTIALTFISVHLAEPSVDLSCTSPRGSDQGFYESAQLYLEKLAAEAYDVAMVKTEANIVDGDIAKMIVEEATRVHPIAVVMGTHSRGLLKSMLQGSVSEYVSHHCPCPVVLVPPKGLGDDSVL